MTEMRRLRTLLAAIVVVCCLGLLVGTATAAPTADAGGTQTANETANDTAAPGAQLSGSFVAEEETLDGELQARSVELRLARADSLAQRLAVLEELRADLSARAEAIENRHDATARAESPARRGYLAAQVATEAAVVSRMADSGALVARQAGDDELAAEFDRLANETAPFERPGGVSTAAFAEFVTVDDRVTDSDVTAVDAGDVLAVEDRRLTEVSDRTIYAIRTSPVVEANRTKITAMSLPERRNATLSSVLTVNETALTTLEEDAVDPLRVTDTLSLDVASLQVYAAERDIDLNDSVLESSIEAPDRENVNDTDGTLDDTDRSLDDTERTFDSRNETLSDTTASDFFNVSSDSADSFDDSLDDSEDTLNETDDTLNDSDSLSGWDGALDPVRSTRRDTAGSGAWSLLQSTDDSWQARDGSPSVDSLQ